MLDDISIFQKKIGSAPSTTAGAASYCPLNEAFWACSGAFSVKSQSHKQNDFRRIWLFTNDDNPNGNDAAAQARIVQASRDCSESGIELSLWHMNRTDRAFDPQRFYVKLLTAGRSSEEEEGDGIADYIENRMQGAGYDGFDMMMANVRRKEHRKRKLGSLMFKLGGGDVKAEGSEAATEVQIALQMYKTVSITTRPTYAWLFRGTNEPLKVPPKQQNRIDFIRHSSQSAYRNNAAQLLICFHVLKMQSTSRMYDGQTGATLDDSQIETALLINDTTRIPFSSDELSIIKQSRGTGIELLYFTPQSVLTPDLNLGTPYFMFPDEKRVQGSTALFAAMVTDMAHRGLVCIVRFTRSAASMPRIAAMIPQMETLSEDGIQVLPLGMHLVQLPFDEEISLKHIEVPMPLKISGAERDANHAAAVAMVKALTIDTAPYQSIGSTIASDTQGEEEEGTKVCYYRDMGNPALQRFYSVLQAIALMENLPSDQAQRDQDLLKPFFCLEPTMEGEGEGEGEEDGCHSESFQALIRKRAILKFKQAVNLDDDAVAISECAKVSTAQLQTVQSMCHPPPR
jgi:hypothetical protein